jgi:hypothetical protein
MSDYEDYCALIKLLNTDDASRHVRSNHRLPAECYSLSDCEYFLHFAPGIKEHRSLMLSFQRP